MIETCEKQKNAFLQIMTVITDNIQFYMYQR